jgi:hypothetical protein
MPGYQTADGSKVWQGNTATDLANAIRQDIEPTHTTDHFIRTWPVRPGLLPGQTVRPGPNDPVHSDDAANWLADLLAIQFLKKAPKFDDAVKVILATFTVFTGLTLTRFLAPPDKILGNNLPPIKIPPIEIDAIHGWRWWAFFTLVALLLRYIIGSAIHLNYVYGGDAPRSNSVLMLFKDLMFLVLFGMVAFYIIDAQDVAHFVRRAMLFVLAGFIWSILDYMARRFMCFRKPDNEADSCPLKFTDIVAAVIFFVLGVIVIWRTDWHDIDGFLWLSAWIVIAGFIFCAVNLQVAPGTVPAAQRTSFWQAWYFKFTHPAGKVPREWPGPFWVLWTCLDGLQFVLTGLAVFFLHNEMTLMRVVAVVYLIFLFVDMRAMLRHVQGA